VSNPLPFPHFIAFLALTLALACLWLQRVLPSPVARFAWPALASASLIVALVSSLIDLRGLVALLVLGAICIAARRVNSVAFAMLAHLAVLTLAAALFLHVVPGFFNPRIVTDAVLAIDSQPYTKYLNFDKGAATLCLLALYVPERAARDEAIEHLNAFAWRFTLVAVVVTIASLAVGYVRWDPKLPPWWGMWLWSMMFFTAAPEETIFRGVAQPAIERWLCQSRHATIIATLVAGVLFGIAHGGGGPAYIVLASIAGIGYGWIYASTRSLSLSIVAHAGLNTLHFLLFSYPALRVVGGP
jgi:membrane protease YdiL (CAAX protease family)